MRTALLIAATALTVASCSKEQAAEKPPSPAAAPAGEGMAYNPATGTTTQAEATPGSLRSGTLDAQPAPLNPAATTGGGAGGVTKNPATPPNTAADGRVDQ